jgi:hypothetical protein
VTLEDDLLKEALADLKANRPGQARIRLAALLQRDPNVERAWLLMSRLVDEPERQRECLERALLLNPGNQEAHTRLEFLRRKASTQEHLPVNAAGLRSSGLIESQPQPAGEGAEEPAAGPSEEAETGIEAEPLFRPEDYLDEGASAVPAEDEREEGTSAIYKEPTPRAIIYMVGSFVIFIALLLLIGGGLSIASLVTSNQRATLEAIHAGETLRARVVLPPTWTPGPSPEKELTPTVTPVLDRRPTPTFSIPGPGAAAELEQIAGQVAELRGLELGRAPTIYLASHSQIDLALYEAAEAAGLLEGLHERSMVLTALGLVPSGYDLTTYTLNRLASGGAGLYIPSRQVIYLAGASLGAPERWAYAHLAGRVLIDQHIGLSELGAYPYCSGDQQRCQAATALVEGDSYLVRREWLLSFAVPGDGRELQDAIPTPALLPELAAPPALVEELNFSYKYGFEFVKVLHKRGGWQAVDQAYREPPTSTEQIIHLEKYLAREDQVPVAPAPLADALGYDWRRIESGTLGEFTTYLIMAHGANPDARLLESQAAQAATGWGGDMYQAYKQENGDQIVVSVQWAWDTQAAADRFRLAMLDYLKARYRDLDYEHPGDCWEIYQQASCLLSSGRSTLWVIAPGRTILDDVLLAYPDFH